MSQRATVTNEAIRALPLWLAFLKNKCVQVEQRLTQLQDPAGETRVVPKPPAHAQDWLTRITTTPTPKKESSMQEKPLPTTAPVEIVDEATLRARELALHHWLDEALTEAEAADATDAPPLDVQAIALASLATAEGEAVPVTLSEEDADDPEAGARAETRTDTDIAAGEADYIALPGGGRMKYLPASERLRATPIASERLAELDALGDEPAHVKPPHAERSDKTWLDGLHEPPTPPAPRPRSPWSEHFRKRDDA